METILTRREKKAIPIIDDPDQNRVGRVRIDTAKCAGVWTVRGALPRGRPLHERLGRGQKGARTR